MAVVLGSPVPWVLGVPATPGGAFPDTPGTYESADGAIVVPGGALDRWYAYRATLGAVRREMVVFGDSTVYGSGGNYSWLQRLRDRAVGFGMADGGKGMFAGGESAISYDSPEVNGFVGQTFSGSSDTFDTLCGGFYYDSGTVGHTITFQFRSTAARLWYGYRATAGDFTYAIDGGSPVTVNANAAGTTNRFAYISGLSAGTTHTIVVTNTSGAPCWIGFAPVNATGLAVQKQARSGATINGFFFGSGVSWTAPYTQSIESFRHQVPLGLVGSARPAPDYTGAAVDTSYAEGARVDPVLSATELGFNDLTNATAGDEAAWVEYVKRFAGACYDADCDGIILSGQLPYNANWPTYGEDRFLALKDQALTEGLAFVDLFYPVAGPSLDYAGGEANPHLTRAEYEDQADYLWDNLLGLV